MAVSHKRGTPVHGGHVGSSNTISWRRRFDANLWDEMAAHGRIHALPLHPARPVSRVHGIMAARKVTQLVGWSQAHRQAYMHLEEVLVGLKVRSVQPNKSLTAHAQKV